MGEDVAHCRVTPLVQHCRPPAGQVDSSFSASLIGSLLYGASRERVRVGVALLAVVGMLRHAEPDSMDAEVSNAGSWWQD